MTKEQKIAEYIERNNVPENLVWDFLRANNYDIEKLYDELVAE